MSKNNNNSDGEPLYIIALHHTGAEQQLQQWVQQQRLTRAQVSGHRMFLYSGHDFDRFRMTWGAGWNHVSVWDNWNRRLVYF